MKTRTAVLAAALATAALAGTASADGTTAPPDEMKAVYGFVGTWKLNMTATMGADSAPVKGTWTCKKVSKGWGVACKLVVANFPGIGYYEENDLFGYDMGSKAYHWYAVTNGGEVHDHVGHFADDGSFTAIHEGTTDGKNKFKEVNTFTFKSARSVTFSGEVSVDGQVQVQLTGTAKKK
jgi:hypothetical protein